MPTRTPLVLLILDGFGYRAETSHNAIAAARTPQWDNWWQTCPHMLLEASGRSVGLPASQMGNSEVGHMHIGAGRVIMQDLTRINDAIVSGDFDNNPVFLETIDNMKQKGGTLHILGLLSPGGVHSSEDHLFALLALCAKLSFTKVCLHLFLDGRDCPPQSAGTSINALKDCLNQYPVATICSVSGRYYAMDRDHRWERTESVYQLLTEANSSHYANNIDDAITSYYAQNISDEFIPPTQIGIKKTIQDGDSLLFFNFRADRARQLTEAFLVDEFQGFERHYRPKITQFISMTPYADYLPTRSAFPSVPLKNTLGEIISKHGLRQLRLAETEKYAHVTFFLNGGSEQIFPGEERILIPSPKVATYDLQPEMSSQELTKTLTDAIRSREYDIIICNYANADMVGHTGNFPAAVFAIECLDKAMQKIWQALLVVGGQLLITADHGNAESMFDEDTKQAHTAHTNQPVPLLFVGRDWQCNSTKGSLVDIAPTVLALLGIAPPSDMTGKILLVEQHGLSN